MMTQDALLERIVQFIAARGMAETTFGRLAVNDGKFVGRLRRRDNMTLATIERVGSFLDSAPPARRAPDQDAAA